jgi:hypothetical protein
MISTTPGASLADGEAPTVIFLHIGKTAGTTLRRILHRNFTRSATLLVESPVDVPARLRREETIPAFAGLPESVRRQARLIEGHTIFGLHEFVPRPSVYITILRDPLALAVSQYSFVRRTPTHWLHDTALRMTFDEYLRSGVSLEMDNSQTRALAGDHSTPFGKCSDELLETAKRNLDSHFGVVGLTERFDESLVLLKRTFGWSRLCYVPANVAPAQRRPPASDSALRMLRDLNRLDIQLWEFARDRFDRRIAEDPGFAPELRAFQRRNRLFRPWGLVTYTYPKRARDRLFPRQRPSTATA